MEVSTAKLDRPRFVRFTGPQDQRLVEIADSEGCTVSDLLRRAAIRTFSLPTNGRNTSGQEERTANAGSPTVAAGALDERLRDGRESSEVEPVLSSGSEKGRNADATPA